MVATPLPITLLPSNYSTIPDDVVMTPCDQTNGNSFLSTGQEIVLVQNTATGTNDVQTVSEAGPPTAGTFTLALTIYGTVYTTAGIAYNATAAAVQAAIRAALSPTGTGLTGVQQAGITCTGGPLPTTPVVVTLSGPLGGQLIAVMVPNSGGLTGGTASVAHTTPGAGDHTYTLTSVADAPFGRTKDEGPITVGGGNFKVTQLIPSLGWASQGLVTLQSNHSAISYCVLRVPQT